MWERIQKKIKMNQVSKIGGLSIYEPDKSNVSKKKFRKTSLEIDHPSI